MTSAALTAQIGEAQGQASEASKARDELQARMTAQVRDLDAQLAAATKARDETEAKLTAQVAAANKAETSSRRA